MGCNYFLMLFLKVQFGYFLQVKAFSFFDLRCTNIFSIFQQHFRILFSRIQFLGFIYLFGLNSALFSLNEQPINPFKDAAERQLKKELKRAQSQTPNQYGVHSWISVALLFSSPWKKCLQMLDCFPRNFWFQLRFTHSKLSADSLIPMQDGGQVFSTRQIFP